MRNKSLIFMNNISAAAIISDCAKGCNLRDLRRIIAKIKNVDYHSLFLDWENIFLSEKEIIDFMKMVERLKKQEPLSKIINCRGFWTHNFFVNEAVLDPRPETELIIEMVLSRFNENSCINILDLGTGSGCIILSLASEYKSSYGYGIDINCDAIEVAQYNKKEMNITNVDFEIADWNNYNSSIKFDIIVSNPPYIKSADIELLDTNVKEYDPILALDGGISGVDAYHSIIPLLHKWLNPGGMVFLEIGYGQKKSVSQIFNENSFEINEIKKDLNGIDRVICTINHRRQKYLQV